MVTWMMMIAGIAVTAATVGALLDPYTPARLLRIVAVVTAGAVAMTWLAMRGIERRTTFAARPRDTATLRQGLREVWSEPRARNFTVFVFLSMTAYFMQELILEPYAGLVFGFTPGPVHHPLRHPERRRPRRHGHRRRRLQRAAPRHAALLGRRRLPRSPPPRSASSPCSGQGAPALPLSAGGGPARLRQRRLRRRRDRRR